MQIRLKFVESVDEEAETVTSEIAIAHDHVHRLFELRKLEGNALQVGHNRIAFRPMNWKRLCYELGTLPQNAEEK